MEQILLNKVNEVIKEYTKIICEKYSLEFEDVIRLWMSDEQSEKKIDKKKKPNKETKQMKLSKMISENKDSTVKDSTVKDSTVKDSTVTVEKSEEVNIQKMTRTELVDLCRKNSLKISGTKEELLQRLNPVLNRKDSLTSKKESLIKKISSQNTSVVEIKRNKFGNYEHSDTGLVFDRDDKIVYGLQRPNGEIEELNEETIELCKKYKFQFKIPENLDKGKTSLKDIKLGGDITEDIFEEEEEEDIKDEDEEEEEIFDDE